MPQPVYRPSIASATCACLRPLAQCRCANPERFGHADAESALADVLFGGSVATVLTLALKLLRPLLLGKARVYAERLRAERLAMAPGARSAGDQLDEIYNATLARLADFIEESSWWRKVILKAELDYVLRSARIDLGGDIELHFLHRVSIREWLAELDVQIDLKSLATERLLGIGIDAEVLRARLAQSYANYTLEDPLLANAAIETVLAGLVAGALAALGRPQTLMLALWRESNTRINRADKDVLAAVARIEGMMVSVSELQSQRAAGPHTARINRAG